MPETPNTLEELLAADTSGAGDAGGKGLRALLENTLAELNRVKAENTQLAQAQQGQARTALFAKHGIPELAQDFFPADSALTDEAATAFIGKYGALWANQSGEATPTGQPAATTSVADQAAAAAMQQLSSTAGQPSLKPLTQEEYAAQFAQATNQAELNQLMEQAALSLQGLGI